LCLGIAGTSNCRIADLRFAGSSDRRLVGLPADGGRGALEEWWRRRVGERDCGGMQEREASVRGGNDGAAGQGWVWESGRVGVWESGSVGVWECGSVGVPEWLRRGVAARRSCREEWDVLWCGCVELWWAWRCAEVRGGRGIGRRGSGVMWRCAAVAAEYWCGWVGG
jgi:hypothetical protein